MERVLIERRLASSPELLFEFLAEHENLKLIFPAKITRVRDGSDGHRNGVGSTRRLRPSPLIPPFEETVTEYVPHELIRYGVSAGSPLRDHRGEMRFAPDGTGTAFRYEITFSGKLPGVAKLVAAMLRRDIGRGLPAVDSAALAQRRVEARPAG
jgi:uncharacterized protein YndB with AHSA1/START domain